jgi:thiamine biosynthesis lipoprotein ApbE
VQYDAVRLDSKRLLAGLRRHGQKIDLGGIAKGYAADSAA